MRTIYRVYLSLMISAYAAGSAYAADDLGDLDVTIRVLDSKQSINEFINRIELPKGVPENARPLSGKTPVTTEDSAKKRRQFDGDSSGRREHNNHRDRGQDKNDLDRNNNGQPNNQNELPATDRPSGADSDHQKDSTDFRDQASDSHDKREDSRSDSNEQKESIEDESHNDRD